MEDIILEKFFEMSRWEYAIDKGVGKDISRRDLCQLAKPEMRVRMYQANMKFIRRLLALTNMAN